MADGTVLGIGGKVVNSKIYRIIVPVESASKGEALISHIYRSHQIRGLLRRRLVQRPVDRVDALRTAYAGATVGDRIGAMRDWWGDGAQPDYVGLIATARAAAALPVAKAEGRDAANLVASMLTAGYDRNAARWARAIGQLDGEGASQVWALLAVGAPSTVVDIGSGRVSSYVEEAGADKGRMLIGALAGLSRLSPQEAASLAQDAGFTLNADSRWARASGAAAQRGEKATVALLAAVGMQGNDWSRLPAAHLYHVVAALHRVGLDPEARMIAAEALSRA